MAGEEQFTKGGLEIPRAGQALRLFGRALRLRCPHCGGGPVLQNWMKLRVRCGHCGLRLQRGEHDYFVGSMVLLFGMAGLFTYAVLVVTMLVTRSTPWDLLQNGLPVVVIVAVVAFFPFSRLLWLAFDILLRPVTPDELDWHQRAGAEFSTDR